MQKMGIISDSAQGGLVGGNRRKPPGGKDDRRPRSDAHGSDRDGTQVTAASEEVTAALGTIRYNPQEITRHVITAIAAVLFTVPLCVLADEVTFGMGETVYEEQPEIYTPTWFGKWSDGQPGWARVGDGWFHVYEDGRRLYEHTFDWVGPFSEGLAPVRKDGQEFHIRMDGSDAYEARYDAVGPFNMGYAIAIQDGNWFHIGIRGTRAYERNFKWVGRMSNIGQASAQDKSGAVITINTKGNTIRA